MRVDRVIPNNRKHTFEVRTQRGLLMFPFAKADPTPSATNRVVNLYVDPELGHEAFTYRLESGAEGSIHVDQVLEYNRDPPYMAELTLYRISVEARERFETSGISARETARVLETSPTQLYRLLDPTNYTKSAKQLFALLYSLGVEVETRESATPTSSERSG